MRSSLRRLTALFILLSFGPLAVGGQGWHVLTEHSFSGQSFAGHSVCRADSCAASSGSELAVGKPASHRHCHRGHANGHGIHAKRQSAGDRLQASVNQPGHNHDLCHICQFFAQPQQSTPIDFVQVVQLFCAELPSLDAGASHALAPLSYRSRAPPLAAHSA
jgi:hypothetical protein